MFASREPTPTRSVLARENFLVLQILTETVLPCYSRHLGKARNKVAGRITRDDSCYSKLWPREFVHTVHAWRVMLGIELWRMRLAACQL